MKNKFDEIVALIQKNISTLYGLNVADVNANLFLPPYNLAAYDLMYVIMNVFKEIGCIDQKIKHETVDKAHFHTVYYMAEFLSRI